MSKNMQVFARLAKIDESKRLVTGIIANETPDSDNEIFDYATSAPNFKKWSENVAKASGGKSVGNVRAMHGKVAAGKLTEIEFDDLNKAISVTAEIVDDGEWNKVMKGLYTGFSIGGTYAKKWDDKVAKAKRYTAQPQEVSLADIPCNPECSFSVQKIDGSTELRKFAGAGNDTPGADSDDSAAPAFSTEIDSLAKSMFPENEELQKTMRDYLHSLQKTDAAPGGDEEEVKVPELFDKIIAKCEGNDDAKRTLITMLDLADPSRPELAKGMCSAATLCDLFERLGWARDSAKWEAQSEGDGSKVPGMFDGVLRSLADVLIAMVKEETAEVIGKTAGGSGDEEELNKAGTGNGGKLRKALGLADDVDDDAVVAGIEKIVANNAELAESLHKHHKLLGEVEAATTQLNKTLKAKDEEIEELKKQLKAPAGDANAPRLRAVEKGDDVGAPAAPKVEKVKGADGKPDDAATMIKSVHAAGGRPLLAK